MNPHLYDTIIRVVSRPGVTTPGWPAGFVFGYVSDVEWQSFTKFPTTVTVYPNVDACIDGINGCLADMGVLEEFDRRMEGNSYEH